MNTKFCVKCKTEKSLDKFYKDKSQPSGHDFYCKVCSGVKDKEYRQRNKERLLKYGREKYRNNREFLLNRAKEYALKRKLLVFGHYGIKCECCGENHKEFLTIDHINGNGNKQRRDNNICGGSGFYRWLIKNNYPKEFRTLCINCNFSLGKYGYCPHKK